MKRSENGDPAVVAIECIAGSSRAEEWRSGTGMAAPINTGDILEEITFGALPPAQAPFKGGRAAVMKLLHAAFKRGDTSVLVQARRGEWPVAARLEFQACIVPHSPAGRRHYVLRCIRDPDNVLGLIDRTESECIALQVYLQQRVLALSNAQLKDGYIPFPWENKVGDLLRVPFSSAFLSLIVLPKASDASFAGRFNSFEDTLAKANAWLLCAQASGVPIVFINIQTEALLTKAQGEIVSRTVNSGSTTDISNLANISLCEFEDYHGIDIGMVRAVRLWYRPVAGEMGMEIKLQEGDTKLGFAISRTDEGFIYISSVTDDDSTGVAAARTRLGELYQRAAGASKLLVVSRLGNEKVLPWMVSTSGTIRCFDTVSLSQKLSLHRHALKPILLHLFMWDSPALAVGRMVEAPTPTSAPQPKAFGPRPPSDEDAPLPVMAHHFFRHRQVTEEYPSLQPMFVSATSSPENDMLDDLVYEVSSGARITRATDTVGSGSLRFRSSDASVL